MTVDDECHCSDSSEPSDLTSLFTEMSSTVNNDADKAKINGENCLCRSVEPTPADSHLAKPVRQVSPQRHKLDGPENPVGQPIVPNSEEERPVRSRHCHHGCEPNVHKAQNLRDRESSSSEATTRRPLREILTGFKWGGRKSSARYGKTYRVKVKKNIYQNYPKSYVCCEMSEGIPKRNDGRKELDVLETTRPDEAAKKAAEKIDVYYFDHGNSAYYRTTDAPPILATEKCAERTDHIATRFWAEIFGTVHIGMAFVTSFILQLIRFLLFSIARPLTVGVVQLTADYLLKPSLSILFNGVVQPVFILLYNVATSFRDLCEPLAEGLGFFLREIAQIFRAFRIVDVNNSRTAGGNGCGA